MAWAQALWAAVTTLTPVTDGQSTFSDDDLVRSMALYPLIGVVLGAVTAAAGATVASTAGQPLAGLLVVVLLDAWSMGRHRCNVSALVTLARRGDQAARTTHLHDRPSGGGIALAALVLLAKGVCAVRMSPAALTAACVLAPMLGRWAIVVQAHGGQSDLARGRAAPLVGRAGFQEFGIASVCTFLIAMSTGHAVGLLLLVAVALETVGLRVLVARRLGGFSGRLLGASAEVAETVVFVVLSVVT